MLYTSTRGQADEVSFSQAVLNGLAPDGGLYIPKNFPDLSALVAQVKNLSYQEIALEIISAFAPEIDKKTLKLLIDKSYSTFTDSAVTPLKELENLSILELFHGPTLAFKDLALQFLGNLLSHLLSERDMSINVLGATSGDTGSAAIHGLRQRDNIDVFIMHPKGRTSALQELQMVTVLDENIHNISIEGSFDDCQALLKKALADQANSDFRLTTVNSVNWARLCAQIPYYFFAYGQLLKRGKLKAGDKATFSVPSGNFGDAFAGYLAMQCGLPVEKIVIATNENNVLDRFFRTGQYSRGDVHQTISPSMDIQVASNFERLLYFLNDKDGAKTASLMAEFNQTEKLSIAREIIAKTPFLSSTISTSESSKAISELFHEQNYVSDPHTIAAVVALEKLNLCGDSAVALATAHPAKFPETVEKATNGHHPTHPSLEKLKGQETRCHAMENSYPDLQQYLRKNIHGL